MGYDLEQRTLNFALSVRDFCRKLKWDIINRVYIDQLIRSSSSIGANYSEANENLGKADLKMRMKIARKEAKESTRWLTLLIVEDPVLETERIRLMGESEELRKILSSIINKLP
jgi:four helix bundle protein